jgi:hypothetical protein
VSPWSPIVILIRPGEYRVIKKQNSNKPWRRARALRYIFGYLHHVHNTFIVFFVPFPHPSFIEYTRTPLSRTHTIDWKSRMRVIIHGVTKDIILIVECYCLLVTGTLGSTINGCVLEKRLEFIVKSSRSITRVCLCVGAGVSEVV